jgi:hypothetical protein
MGQTDRCGICLYWDHRTEAEVDEHTGYCTVHEMMKRDEQSCDFFNKRTTQSEQQYYQKLYNDGTDYEGSDLDVMDH